MKTLIFITLLFILSGFRSALTSNTGDYPIPSFDVSVNGYANFAEQGDNSISDQVTGKRQAHVYVHTQTPGSNVSIWVYPLDRTEILGPFTVGTGETLDVDIDTRPWGILVYSENDNDFDVWIE